MGLKLEEWLPSFFHQKIENLEGLGTPDRMFGYKNRLGVMELKRVDTYRRGDLRVPWRTGQMAWYKRYVRHNAGPYYLVLTVGDSWFFMDINNIKEVYTREDLEAFFLGTTEELNSKQSLVRFILTT